MNHHTEQASTGHRKLQKRFKVLEGYKNVMPYIEDVRQASDSHRHALGFVPESVFEEFAQKDHLLVVVDQNKSLPLYAGHLMFRRRFPRAQIIQMFSLHEYRRQGIATILFRYLRDMLTKEGFTSIYARVAEDLDDANAFWEKHGFHVQRIERGGKTKDRIILVRYHELDTPQLFATSGLDSDDPLGLSVSSLDDLPLYLIDLNVLYDLSPHRFRRDTAINLFRAERFNFCRLAVSDEFNRELKRTAHPGKTDPMEGYVSIFPILPLAKGTVRDQLLQELAEIVFPEKKKLSQQDQSDLRHLATAIQHRIAGFITNDKRLSSAASQLQCKYGIDVVSPTAFTLDSSPAEANVFQVQKDIELTIKEFSDSDSLAARELLDNASLSSAEIANGWLPNDDHKHLAMRYGVWNGSVMEGYVTWSGWAGSGAINIRAVVNEQSASSIYVARLIMTTVLDKLSTQEMRKLSLGLPENQPTLRELAISMGFRGQKRSKALVKISLGRIIFTDNWESERKEILLKTNIRLPESIPLFRSPSQRIDLLIPNGAVSYVVLDELETLLSPTFFCLPGRPAVITPIQRKFSEHLLRCTPQIPLLSLLSSSLFYEKHYISGPNTLALFQRGTLILFYESLKQGGRGEIIAIARTREAYLKSMAELSASDFEQSVLSSENVSEIGSAEMKTITSFDCVFELQRPISVERLKELGCGKPNDLITTRPISDTQLHQILIEGFSYG